ncbi:MAG TPA: HDOD domain-containing protein [Tepidisphaeraceae bacterium]|jgi:HD-like signal output (HDOD) protein|nr:HDOD domain-containing protein [Tepidisphaeraceae bacterium]
MATAAAVDPQELIKQAVKKVTSIATLPEITSRIIKTVEDPKSTAAILHKIVSHDPALVTRILKVVNSAFYGLPGQIGSIERAIVLLGLNAVKNIAVAASLGQLFRGVKLCEGFTAKDLWTHCVSVAVVARALAKQTKLPLADEAFLAGMIHDIGLLVALQTSPEQLRQVCDRAKAEEKDFCEIEREVLGVDHQQLGAGLADAWKFPRSCQLVAGFHHQPMQLTDDRVLVGLVHVADTLCAQNTKGFNLTAHRQQIDASLLAQLNLDSATLEQFKLTIPTLVADAASLLG